MIRRPPRYTQSRSSAASDVYKRQLEDGLRKEVDAGSKDFRLIDSQYQIIKGSSDTGPGDLARIFAFMKAIDPTSAVREGEQASAANAGGVPSAIWSIYNKALGAGKLSPQLRAEFTREAEKIWKIAKAKNDLIMSRAEVIISCLLYTSPGPRDS